jgi:hypothetical protein
MTTQESDELILQALMPESGTSDSNDDRDIENDLDEPDESEDEDDESALDIDDKEADDTPTPPAEQKKSSNIVKVLSERNQLKARVKELEEKYESTSVKDMKSIHEMKTQEMIEEAFFFRENPDAELAKDEIKELAENHNLDLKTAFALYRTLDPQESAKREAKKYSVTGTSSKKSVSLKADDFSPENLARFDQLVKSGKVRV